MTPILAGQVDIDFNSFVVTCIMALVGAAVLAFYLSWRRLTKRQWLIASCAYLGVVLVFLWFANK